MFHFLSLVRFVLIWNCSLMQSGTRDNCGITSWVLTQGVHHLMALARLSLPTRVAPPTLSCMGVVVSQIRNFQFGHAKCGRSFRQITTLQKASQ